MNVEGHQWIYKYVMYYHAKFWFAIINRRHNENTNFYQVANVNFQSEDENEVSPALWITGSRNKFITEIKNKTNYKECTQNKPIFIFLN